MKYFVVSNTLFSDQDKGIIETVQNWNKTVSPNDYVFILGNFSLDPITFGKVVNTLNGKKEFIVGEMDPFLNNYNLTGLNITNSNIINDSSIIVLDSKKVVLSFWPLRLWPNKDKGYVNIYGYPTMLVEHENKTGSAALNSNFGNKPIELDFFIDLLNEKI